MYTHVPLQVHTEINAWPDVSLDPLSNEKLLFHGTRAEVIDSVIKKGASEKYGNVGKKHYLGFGIYMGKKRVDFKLKFQLKIQ